MVDDTLGLTPTAEELIDEIGAEFYRHQKPPENSFTLADFAHQTGARNISSASRYLEDQVMMGKLAKVRIGKKNYYYRVGK